jgi:mannose-1-phosphate guanylyltransferase
MAVFAIVLAGGAGTRFWPASRVSRPKQLLALAGADSLLASTVKRIASIVPPERVVVATGAHLASDTRAALPEVPAENFLAEPTPRNTAPAIAWATAEIARRDPDALCMVLPSDHFITDENAFLSCAREALEGARRGHLVTLGVKPTRAETGFGYVEVGAAIEGALHAATRFVEKPTSERAAEYLASGKYLWNAGMFFFSARAMMDALREHLPDVARIASSPNVASEFASMPSISIDHGVMEKARSVAVVPGDFGWSDLGSWQTAWELATKDADGNALPDCSVAIDSHDNLVWDRGTSKRTYALVGVSNLVVVETEDAVLVVSRDRAQDVKLVVEKLRALGSKKI